MRPCRYFFLLTIVAIAAILSAVLWNGGLEGAFTSNTTGNQKLLTGRGRNVELDGVELGSAKSSIGVRSDNRHVPKYEPSNDVMFLPNKSQDLVFGGDRLESEPQLSVPTPRRYGNESVQGSVSSSMISDFEFLLNEGYIPENLTFSEEMLWTKAKGAKNKRGKRDLTRGFFVEDLEKIFGNDVVLSQDELSILSRRVIEDLKKCDLMSLYSNFVSIPGYIKGKSREKLKKKSRRKRSANNNKMNSELPVTNAEYGSMPPDFLQNSQTEEVIENILKRSKRSFGKIFNFFKPSKAPRYVPELIRGEGFPSEIHKVVTPDGYALELHRIPGPRYTKKSQKKKFQKRDIHPDDETFARFLEKLEQDAAPHIVNFSLSFDKTEDDQSTTAQADHVLNLLDRNKDYFNTLPHVTVNSNFKFSSTSGEKFDNKSSADKINSSSEALQYSSESIPAISSFQANQSPVLNRTKRSSERSHNYPVFLHSNYDSSPEYVTSNLKRKKIPTSSNLNEHFDVLLEKWVPRPRYRRPSILLHHGLFASSANFVLSDGEGGALAYLLANAGYDVWLGNWRGNTYSTGHTTLDPGSRQYWNFSLDEIIKYDIPTAVNYILAVNGQHSLRYVGHSLGCAMLFGATNEDPSLASKVKMMVAMAPAAFMDNSYGVLKNTILSIKNFYYLLDRLRLPDLLSPAPVPVQLANYFCGPSSFWRVPCMLLVDAFMGKIKQPMKEYYTNVLLAHFPSTLASTRILAHFGQFVDAYGMRKYNYGPDGNYLRYGQRDPPKYSFSTVTFPVVVFYGPGDTVVTPKDVLQSARRLPNLILAVPVVDKDFNHLDFIIPEQAQGLVYKPILKVLDFYRCDCGPGLELGQ